MSVKNNLDGNEDGKQPEEIVYGKTWPQVFAIVSASLAALTCGIQMAWTSPFIIQITKDKINYDITEEEASYLTVFPPLGMMVASFFFYMLNDKIGRKLTLLTVAVPQITFWLITIFARKAYILYIARFISGIGDAAAFSTLPMYIGEVTTPQVRCKWGYLMIFLAFSGQFVINLVGGLLNVQVTAYILITIPVVFAVTLSQLPESPYFYLIKNNVLEAEKSLKWLRGTTNVEREFKQIKADVERQMSESGTWRDLIMIRSNRKALLCGVFLRIFQMFSGLSVFVVYTQYIFEKSGSSLDSHTSSLLFTGLCCSLNLIAGVVLNKLGRKKAYLISTTGCGTVLFIEALYCFLDQFTDMVDVSAVSWLPVLCMMLYMIFFSIGLGIVPTLILSEIFSASIKTKGVCILAIVFACSIFITNNLFYFLNSVVGLYSPFLLFSICCFTAAILSIFLLPNTEGKTLEEIQQELKKH